MSAPSPWYKCCFSVETGLEPITPTTPTTRPQTAPSMTHSLSQANALDAKVQAAAKKKEPPGKYSPRPKREKRQARLTDEQAVRVQTLFLKEKGK